MKIKAQAMIITAAVLSFDSLGACASSGNPTEIEKALTVSKGIGYRDAALATKYIDSQHFKNHNPMAYYGVDGIEGLSLIFLRGNSPLKVVRAFQNGPYVFTHSEGDLFGQRVFFDIAGV